MNFQQAIESGFKKFATFNGRASRSEHNYFFLFNIIVSVLTIIVHPMLNSVIMLLFLLPSYAMIARRFHDINKSGWNYFWMLTIIGIFPVLYWIFFKEGDNDSNDYGDNPLKDNLDD